jgi:hydroxymethylglutaryl-CoA synthase
MRGIISCAAYVPYQRLQRAAIGEIMASAGGKGTRSVASYDEDTTTMGVEAGRLALRSANGVQPDALTFATTVPAYLDKTNATAIHAALRLESSAFAADMGGAPRSAVGALLSALEHDGATLVVSSDIRTGRPTSADERDGGDAAAALLVGTDAQGPVIAEYLGSGSATEEFLDRWRSPGDAYSRVWEERFGETRYLPLVDQAWNAALKATDMTAEQVDRLVVTGMHTRAVRSAVKRLGTAKEALVNDLSATVGNTGTAHAALLLTSALQTAEPGQTIAVVTLADGVDVLLFRTTDLIKSFTPARSVAAQIDSGSKGLPYGKFLTWRGALEVEPPRRPEPNRPSASAAGRNHDWKFGFVAARDRTSKAMHFPPARVSWKGGAIDDMEAAPMADVPATIVTFTVDHVSYSPSPPIVAAIVDFDGGGRFPCELTDCDASDVKLGDRVEMTFRRLFTVQGMHNYFWKARPIRG